MDKYARKPVNYSMTDRHGAPAVTGFVREKKGDWEYYHLPELTAGGIIHGFFTRKSPSSTLLGREGEAFLDAFSLNEVVVMHQEHGHEIQVIGNGDRPACGDGILLYKRGIAGVIKTADCLCVILVDPGFPMAAIVHAGWRGTLQRITPRAVDMMTERGAAKQRMVALMGPSIRNCCYVVGEEVRDAYLSEGFPDSIFSESDGSLYLDLGKANALLLTDEGIETIHDTGLCTCCTGDDFASYRKGARNARQVNFVAIRGR